MFGRRSFFSQVLEEGDALLGLFKYLMKKWAVPEAFGVHSKPLPPIEHGIRDRSC